ncbi:MGMT family protein [bacterium]|nr:MGMT family protein [bacterium]
MKTPREDRTQTLYLRIYAVVNQVPAGRVATYGQVAGLAGGCSPRQVGYAMAAVRDPGIPWHRVINSRGKISFPAGSEGFQVQKKLLEDEGIIFDEQERISLKLWGWEAQAL